MIVHLVRESSTLPDQIAINVYLPLEGVVIIGAKALFAAFTATLENKETNTRNILTFFIVINIKL